MDEMKYLPAGKGKRRFLRWVLVGLAVFVGYIFFGTAITRDEMQKYVVTRSPVEVVRYEVYPVGDRSLVVQTRDVKDGRTAMAFVKFPIFDRWILTERIAVDGLETRPIPIRVDDGFRVLKTEVSFDRVDILGSIGFSGSYARTIGILAFMLLAVGINFFLDKRKRRTPQV